MKLSYWQGEKVHLRSVEPDDWQVFRDWNLDSESARSSYFIPFPQSSADLQRMANQLALQRGENDEFRFMIEDNAGKVIGTLNTHGAERRNGVFRYGVAVRREYWGKGYAVEAVRLVLAYFFDELGYQKCNVDVFDFNPASIRLHEKLGFVFEGQIRRSVFTNGRYHDSLIYGITVEEFREKWGTSQTV